MDLTIRESHTAEEARSSERGFTLVELMVVVAIIALLASIVIPNYVHARAQAAVSQTQANMKVIGTALEEYYEDNENYPPAGANGSVTPKTLFGSVTNPYLTVTPTNALGRKDYTYAYVAGGAGTPPSYLLTDAGPYDATTLANLTKGPGGGTLCGSTGCTGVYYDPQDGFYGK